MEIARYSGDQVAMAELVRPPLELAWVECFPGFPARTTWPTVAGGLGYLPTHRGTLQIVDMAGGEIINDLRCSVVGEQIWSVGRYACFHERDKDRLLTVMEGTSCVARLPVPHPPVGVANLDGSDWLVTVKTLVCPKTGDVRPIAGIDETGNAVAVFGGALAVATRAGSWPQSYYFLNLVTGERIPDPKATARVGDWMVTFRTDGGQKARPLITECVRYRWRWVTEAVNLRSGATWSADDLASHVPIVGREDLFVVNHRVWQFLAPPATSRLPRPRPAPVLGRGHVWAQGFDPDGSRRLAQLDSGSGDVVWSLPVEDWGFLVPAEDGLLRVTRDHLEFYVSSGGRTSRAREASSVSAISRSRVPFVSRVGSPSYSMAVDGPVLPEVEEAIEQLRLSGWFQQYPAGDEVAKSYRQFHGGASLDRDWLIPSDLDRGDSVGYEGQGAETIAAEFLAFTFGLFGIEAVQETWWDDENRVDLGAVYSDGRIVTCSFEVADPEPQGQVWLAHFLRLVLVDRPDLAAVELSGERVVVVDRARFEALAPTGAFGSASILEEVRPGVGPFAYFDAYSSPDA